MFTEWLQPSGQEIRVHEKRSLSPIYSSATIHSAPTKATTISQTVCSIASRSSCVPFLFVQSSIFLYEISHSCLNFVFYIYLYLKANPSMEKANISPASPFWGPISSNVDWCETNYTTVSSIRLSQRSFVL